MKKYKIIIVSILVSNMVFSQSVQVTIKKDATATNKFGLYMKLTGGNITNQYLNTVQFAISLPNSVSPLPTITTTPTAELNQNVTPDPWTTETDPLTGQLWNTQMWASTVAPATPLHTWIAGTEYKLLDITFTGGTANLTNIRFVAYPDGGTNLNSYTYLNFNVSGDIMNAVAQYYTNPDLGEFRVDAYGTGFSYMGFQRTLPITVLSFTTTASGDHVSKLDWATATEANASHFEVWRSLDGIKYGKIGTDITARGSNSTYTTYDNKAESGINYYKLRMFDKDGSFKESEVRTVRFGDKYIFTVYPNPAQAEVNVSGVSVGQYVKLSGTNGQVIQVVKCQGNIANLKIGSLAKGAYLIQVLDDQNILMTQKVVKE